MFITEAPERTFPGQFVGSDFLGKRRQSHGFEDNGPNFLSNAGGEAPGLGFMALCQTCTDHVALGSGDDPRCTKYARHPLRCSSICCAAVRGACSVHVVCAHRADTEDMWVT
ncbi:hypothetical protein ACHAXT_008010 [Thalassiosira profunda]